MRARGNCPPDCKACLEAEAYFARLKKKNAKKRKQKAPR